MFYRKDIFIFKWQQLQWNEICCPIPLFYINGNVSVTFSINYTKRCMLSVIDHCIFFLYLISDLKKKKKKRSYWLYFYYVNKKKVKGNPILLGSRWTSEIKIGSLRCKCWNNVLHVGSKLLMYIVYKPGLSLSRVAKLVKWNWWCWCWSKGPAMHVFRNLRVLRNVHIPYCLVITQHLRGTDRERQSSPLSLIKSITELIGWKNTLLLRGFMRGRKGSDCFIFPRRNRKTESAADLPRPV